MKHEKKLDIEETTAANKKSFYVRIDLNYINGLQLGAPCLSFYTRYNFVNNNRKQQANSQNAHKITRTPHREREQLHTDPSFSLYIFSTIFFSYIFINFLSNLSTLKWSYPLNWNRHRSNERSPNNANMPKPIYVRVELYWVCFTWTEIRTKCNSKRNERETTKQPLKYMEIALTANECCSVLNKSDCTTNWKIIDFVVFFFCLRIFIFYYVVLTSVVNSSNVFIVAVRAPLSLLLIYTDSVPVTAI